MKIQVFPIFRILYKFLLHAYQHTLLTSVRYLSVLAINFVAQFSAVAHSFTYLSYKETGYFSQLVTDHIAGHENLLPFYNYSPNAEGLDKAINDRAVFPTNREILTATFKKQYEHLSPQPETEKNIQSLLSENTFTVCTAHQPNLLTGYLYFVYKILHAIKLAQQLNEQFPDRHFVPVFYLGSEDNDIDELGTFRFRGDEYVWDGDGQTGAVGRMHTKGLKPMLNDLFKWFGPPGKNCEDLQSLITTAYLKHDTIASATQYLVHELFGRYGLLVLNPDDAVLKSVFIPVMQDELLNGNAYPIVSKQIEQLAAHYKIQASPRPINLFYLTDNIRDRIERTEDGWRLSTLEKKWTQTEIIAELQQHPERFSPNVVLRGLFQETILPNVAFIGGGAEVAYWMQLKTLFAHYNLFFPCVLLRQSVQWIGPEASALRTKLGLSVNDLFKPEIELIKSHIITYTGNEWQTTSEAEELEQIFTALRKKAETIDPTLAPATQAVLARMNKQLAALEKKMFRAEKRKEEVYISRISKMKSLLFPNSALQERVENFMEYYLASGPAFFDIILDGIEPLSARFLVVE
jgi:bacillithiol biosynthesis cysteine-adding enzyme BshC